ncbi:MAG: L-serine ammonia-lyase, iron-sulfur-dependent, subunit alpha [Clostridiales bacterium]|jgi:L-serine dehydratase|nr:L-serine ammonia-lyase, iron-sulfur-dependent, subunit alpha [Clostridiales bacterium]
MSFRSLEEIIRKSKETGKAFWEIVMEDDMNERAASSQDSFHKMKLLYLSMRDANAAYDKNLKSASELVGGDGEKVHQALKAGKLLSGTFGGEVIAKALKMGENNACMKRIVAAPTAGSCGVLPAVLLTYEEQMGEEIDRMVEAMFVASGIGVVISVRAFLAGAAGGCQAEIGSASAMAAGALAYLQGGDGECIAHASALTLKNLLGLVCDPVAGLVEVPCVKRNVVGAINAIASADMAIAGVRSQIPPDEVIDAMREVGEAMPSALRETGEGGLAGTPTGIKIRDRVLMQ